MTHPTVTAPIRRPRPLPDRLVRGTALLLLSVLLIYLRTLAAIVRLGIGALRKVRAPAR
jgi:hypothetical protein